MLLGVISMFCFEILSDFGENRKRGKLEKSRLFGFLRRSVGNPRRGVALHCSVGCPLRGEAEVPKMAPPCVRYGVVVLLRSVDTVHSE